jgi:hypothetical protein
MATATNQAIANLIVKEHNANENPKTDKTDKPSTPTSGWSYEVTWKQ